MKNPRTHWSYTDSYDFMEQTRAGLPPMIICCACNGGIQGREANPAIPETPEEIAASVEAAYEAGASMVHVHARKPDVLWRPADTAEVWLEVNARIRERCPDIIINNTTGGGPGMTHEQRLKSLEGRPEVASLNTIPDMSKFRIKPRPAPLPHPHDGFEIDECMAFTYGDIEHFAAEMQKRNIKPEFEVYHSGGAQVIQHLIRLGLVTGPYWVQTVMGAQTASYPTPDNLISLLREFPEDAIWLTSGIGQFQLPMTAMATLMGGHVRVGLEDNVYYARGELAKSNGQLVARAARLGKEMNRKIATPAEARAMLGLSPIPSSY